MVSSLYIYANVDPIGIRNTLYDYSRSRSQGVCRHMYIGYLIIRVKLSNSLSF